MNVPTKTRRETPPPRQSLTGFDLFTREWPPLSDPGPSSASIFLDPSFIYRTRPPRQNPTARSVANSEDEDRRVPEIEERTSLLESGIIRNQETEISNNLNTSPVSSTNLCSTPESSNNHAIECRPQAPSSSPPSPNDGSDEIIRAFMNIRLGGVRPSSVRDPDIPEHQYYPHAFRPDRLAFRQVIHVMKNFNFEPCVDRSKIGKQTLRAFSLLIYGIPPDYREEYLSWVAFFFFERYFAVQAEFEFCVKNLPNLADPNVIGVVFKDAKVRHDILLARRRLEGTGYRLETYKDVSWIIDLCRSQSWN